MEICDLINETEEGPKDAIKAIRRRLQQSVGKNYTIVMFTLTVRLILIVTKVIRLAINLQFLNGSTLRFEKLKDLIYLG